MSKAALTEFKNGDTQVLDFLVPQWRELFASIFWRLYDQQDPDSTAFRKRIWRFSVNITWRELAIVFELLCGPRTRATF